MSHPVIEVENLSKRYVIGHQRANGDGVRHLIENAVRAPLKFLRDRREQKQRQKEEFWALKNVSFEVKQGDVIGIIGGNGAGKSTLLKILSRITEPTTGKFSLKGRVASLLEVGTGFHPELTGRENIFLNGAILGMSRADIKKRFDEIVAFSEIEKFLDTPVKRYSSGMYVRLAFSVAAHLDPEILIVDEVLAVGDVAFQKKCLGKMAEARAQARTVLFVSHNLSAVESFCRRGIVLKQGGVIFDGECRDAIQCFLNSMKGTDHSQESHIIDLSSTERPPQFTPQIKRLELYYGDGRPYDGMFPAGGSLKAVITAELDSPSSKADMELAFFTLSGQRICTAHSAYDPARGDDSHSREKVFICEIDCLPLLPGEYKVQVGVDISLCAADVVEDAARLNVVKSDFYGTGVAPIHGVFMLNNRWTIEKEEELVAV